METFKEMEREDRMTVVLGGKVLVVDIDFSIDRVSDPLKPQLDIKSLKTSYAVSGGALDGTTSNKEGSASLDALLAESIRDFLREVHKATEEQNAIEAARLGNIILEQLKYLITLDKLAAKKEDENGGIRWFVDIDHLGASVEKFAAQEASAIASYVFCSS